MGCGASSPVEESGGKYSPSKGSEQTSKRLDNRNGNTGAQDRGGAGHAEGDTPNNNVAMLADSGGKWSRDPMPVLSIEDTLLTALKIGSDADTFTVAYTFPIHRLKLRSSPVPLSGGVHDDQLINFPDLINGSYAMVRRPPLPLQEEDNGDDCIPLVTVSTEFGGDFTFVLTAEEAAFVMSTTLKGFVQKGYVSAEDPTFARFMKGGTLQISKSEPSFATTPPIRPLAGGGKVPSMNLDGAGAGPTSGAAPKKQPKRKEAVKGNMDVRRTISSFVSQRFVKDRLVKARVKSLDVRVIFDGCGKRVGCIAISNDEKVVAYTTVSGPDIQPRRYRTDLNLPAAKPFTLQVSRALASISLTIRTACTRTGRELCIFRDEDSTDLPSLQIIFSQDNQLIYSTTMEGLTMWDTNKRKKIRSIHFGNQYEQPARITGSATTPDVKTFALTGELDGGAGVVGIFKENRQVLSFESHESAAMSAALTSSGNHCASGGYEGDLKIWDALTGDVLISNNDHKSAITSMIFLDDNTLITVDPSFVRGWHVPTGGAESGDNLFEPLWTLDCESDERIPWEKGMPTEMEEMLAGKSKFSRVSALPGGLIGVSRLAKQVLSLLINLLRLRDSF